MASCVRLLLFVSLLGMSKTSLQTLEEFEFPPKFVASNNPKVPAGHLKPFGYHKPPDGPVAEYYKVLHPEELWVKHVTRNKPAVFRQAIGKSSAIPKWSDEYLKRHYGDLDVLIELKKENRSFEARRATLATFIDNYKQKDIYVVTVLPDPMRKEIQVPACLLCGSFVDLIHETNFWMSSGGTRSLIHFDADHILHCLVAGRKDWILMNQEHVDNLYMEKRAHLSGSGFTLIDPDKVDMLKYPKVANVSWEYTTLYPGDCLFFPSEYIHQVRSYIRSISATMLFTTDDRDFDNRGCDKMDLNANVTLDKVHVHWTYNKGDNIIEMGYMNIEMLRNTILEAMRRHQTDKLDTKLFEKFWFHSMDEESEKSRPRGVFRSLLDKEGRGFLTKEDVERLSVDTLKELARIMDPPHGPMKQDQLHGKIPEPKLGDEKELKTSQENERENEILKENEDGNENENENEDGNENKDENEMGNEDTNERDNQMNEGQENESLNEKKGDLLHIEL